MRARYVAAAAVVVAVLVPVSAASASPHVVTIADPSTSRAPSQAFRDACHSMSSTQSANQACDPVAIHDFNSARAAEGVKALVLPDEFDTLTVPTQVLVITNLERIDRGLPPVPGLSSRLNGLAQQGANANQDPPFPSPFDGTSARGNWSDGNSALLAAYLWMYDDGPGSPNSECVTPGPEPCWGHRHTILDSYDSPIAMGAAFATTSSGGSITEEIVGGDSTDTIDQTPTWADISGTLTYGVSPANVRRTVDVGMSTTALVTATSAGGEGDLTAGFQSGAPTWSVSPPSCHLDADGTCMFTLTFAPTATGHYPGVLTISDGTTAKTVALSGDGITAQVALAVNTGTVSRGRLLVIHGLVTADPTNAALANREVKLQQKIGSGGWATIKSATTGGRGKVTYRLHPTSTAKYRLEVLRADGFVASKSSAVKVRVT